MTEEKKQERPDRETEREPEALEERTGEPRAADTEESPEAGGADDADQSARLGKVLAGSVLSEGLADKVMQSLPERQEGTGWRIVATALCAAAFLFLALTYVLSSSPSTRWRNLAVLFVNSGLVLIGIASILVSTSRVELDFSHIWLVLASWPFRIFAALALTLSCFAAIYSIIGPWLGPGALPTEPPALSRAVWASVGVILLAFSLGTLVRIAVDHAEAAGVQPGALRGFGVCLVLGTCVVQYLAFFG